MGGYKRGVDTFFHSVLNKMDFDEVCFQRSEIEDYNVEDLVISPDSIMKHLICLLYTSPSPRDAHESRMPSSA